MKINILSRLLIVAGLLLVGLGTPVWLSGQRRAASEISVSSPDNRVEVKIELTDWIAYSVYFEGKQILAPSPVSMTMNDNVVLGRRPVLENTAICRDKNKPYNWRTALSEG